MGTHTFNIGTTTINYTVTDAAGNTTPGSLVVNVSDNEDPKIILEIPFQRIQIQDNVLLQLMFLMPLLVITAPEAA